MKEEKDNKAIVTWIGAFFIGVLMLTIVSMFGDGGIIETVHILLFVFVFILGGLTAWHVYTANEKKFLFSWCMLFALYFASIFIGYKLDGAVIMTTTETLGMFIGSIPIIVICKKYS
jgi:glucan phosphoethanolaminetransferase (alkaline phosphatase superfamily)